MEKIGIIRRYKNFLPDIREDYMVSLGEGDTPLVRANSLETSLSLKETKIYYKLEGLNPTGSFKDRGMTLAISKALEQNAKSVVCASTGNTSASAAAFSARCGLNCYVLIPEGKIAKGKLAQAYLYGAKVIMINGNFDQALRIAQEISKNDNISIVNSVNPYRLEGQKTAAFEIVDQLGYAPDYHVLPVGNAGNITAYWKGYNDYLNVGISKSLPKMIGFQAKGASPIVQGRVIDHPETIATAIRIGNPASWDSAIGARDQSKGLIDSVTDGEITDAYRFMANREGIFAEPASAAGVAGVIKLAQRNYFKEDSTIVITLTGSGLKDPDFAMNLFEDPTIVDASYDSIKSLLE